MLSKLYKLSIRILSVFIILLSIDASAQSVSAAPTYDDIDEIYNQYYQNEEENDVYYNYINPNLNHDDNGYSQYNNDIANSSQQQTNNGDGSFDYDLFDY